MKLSSANSEGQDHIFTNEQKDVFLGFFDALRRVHNRLISEGYVVKDGEIIPPQQEY